MSVSSSQIGKEFGKGCSLSQSCCMAFWALCTLCCMISYLLLLNEHKETSDFGLGCPYHSYSIFIPHIPVGVFLLFVWVFLSPQSFFFPSLWQLKDQQHYSPCTWFVHLKGKKNILNMMPAEPGALISYKRTQICTFCQSGGGFPTETRDWVSQNLNLEVQ